MTPERLNLEKQVLQKEMPMVQCVFKDMSTSEPYVLMPVKTNIGKVYTIRIDLKGFPNQLPHAFVTKMLQTKSGRSMNDASAAMHTLPTEHGYTRICHYGSSSWTPMVSLFKVYIKCALWLNMYELHLKTGKDMDYYLSHQS
ncbi:MAG: hypothetical protein KBT32_05130 [Bacteroidales bacterium]|nr:hypothetical protein [Candidatus Physcocola equi]